MLKQSSWSLELVSATWMSGASFRIPVNHVMKVRLNAGPFIGLSSPASIETAVEGGVEYRKYYVGVSWLQNFVNDNSARFHFSVDYKFHLWKMKYFSL